MSLNGLEAPEVNDAYQAALGEGGGWFLLNYTSRDEVGLLAKGNGGLAELEEVVSRYEEQSPLYGFIQYRRRKVVLRYMPEGTSKVLQARVTVQFEAVKEKLSPYDTRFEFAQSADLSDSALTSACSLHTATASVKSSSDSLPQRGLAEIAEDASESRIDAAEGGVVVGGTTTEEEQSLGAERSRPRPEKVNGSTSAEASHHRSASSTTQSFSRPRTTSNTDKPLPPPPEDHVGEGPSLGTTLDPLDYSTRPSMDGRFSSGSTRPSTKDLYDAYGFKIKARMGPRPSTDSAGAPQNLLSRTDELRPVSTLPAGLRMPSRKAVPARAASRQVRTSSPTRTSSPVIPCPPAQDSPLKKTLAEKAPNASVAPIHIPDQNLYKPNHGMKAMKSPKMPEPKSQKMTPEKQRLMKALQLRQKQMAARNPVNGLGIKSVSEGPDFAKSEIDDSILNAVIDTSNPAEGPEAVQITVKDIAKEDSRHLEDSPISMPETVEESSTNASSVMDEEEVTTQKRQELQPTSGSTLPENQDPMNEAWADDCHSKPNGRQVIAPEEARRTIAMKTASVESLKDISHSPARTRPQSLLADNVTTEQTTVERVLPKSSQNDLSSVISEKPLNEVGRVTEEELRWDTQLLPSLLLEGHAGKSQSTAKYGPPVVDRRYDSAPVVNRDTDIQQSEPLAVTGRAIYTGRSSSEEHPQRQSTEDDERVPAAPATDELPQVLPGQSQEGHRQLSERPARSPDKFVPREAQNNTVKPLLVRRSSSSKSMVVPLDDVNAHEIPLPPIDEYEKTSLNPQRALPREQAATDHPLVNDSESVASVQAQSLSPGSDQLIAQSATSTYMDKRQTGTQVETQVRKQETIDPIKRVPSPDQSDEHFLLDDSFMEELKCATVQEAKPVSVSKSPIKPVFSRSESEQRQNATVRDSRSVSTPVGRSTKDEEVFCSPRLPTPPSTSRSFSVQHAPRPDSQQSQVLVSKKIGVSSSISQRIKALEQLSSRPTSPVSPNSATNTSGFPGLRKTSLRTPSGASDYSKSNPKSHPAGAYPSPSLSPEPVKSSFVNQSNKAASSHPPESVKTIVSLDKRDQLPANPFNQSEPRQLSLQEDPLQHKREKSPPPPTEPKAMGQMWPPPLSPLKPPRPRFGRYASTRSGSSSSNEQKLEPSPNTRRESFASIRSKSSRAGSEVELPRTLSDSSASGVTSLDGTQDEKKDSRRSRLLRRMSSISTMSRRSIAHALSPSPKQAPIIERQEPVQEGPSTSVDVGDVNVQFPDTLLWKRRHMIIDSQGVLVLSASKSDNNSKVVTKRYPLSEFLPPYIPDQDRQELPNSVILDFKDGSTLQCACEHLQGQAGVLKALRHAHSTH
ncbi:hypothetical protein BDR22DRAFT_480010 [Usnea florida]